MADEAGDSQSKSSWPVPKFHFKVDWGGDLFSFQEVSGLDAEVQPIEYRSGDSPNYSVVKMPGLKKYSDITLKKGIFLSDLKLWSWFAEIKMNTIKRRTVTIQLLNEGTDPVMVWKLTNAFPLKMQGTDLKAQGNEAAIETLVVTHEGLEVSLS